MNSSLFKIIMTLGALLCVTHAGVFSQGDQIKLIRREPLLFRDEVFRTGEEGEVLTVLAYRPDQKKIFVIAKDKNGQDIALSIPEEAVALIEIPSQLEVSESEKRYTIAMENLLIARTIVRFAREAGDQRLANLDNTLAAVNRNRADLFDSPVMHRVMAVASITSQLAPQQARNLAIKGMPNLFDCVLRRNLPAAVQSGDVKILEALLDGIESGLPAGAAISRDLIEERSFQISGRDLDRCFRMPMFKRAPDFNGRSFRRWMAGRIVEAGILNKATAAMLGGEIGLERFMTQFVTPQEATDTPAILAKLKNSFPKMPDGEREALAGLLANKTETLLGNGDNLAGFGFDSTFDAEVAFAASSDPVTTAMKGARDNLLKSLDRENP